MNEPATLVGLLRARASERPDRVAFSFLADGERESARLTYAELERASAAIAAALRAAVPAGERALLLYPSGLDFIAAYLGCLEAGVVAVPAYPPRPNDRSQLRIRSIVRDAEPRVVLATSDLADGSRALLGTFPELAAARWILTDALDLQSMPGVPPARGPEPDPASVAFLQYTSGSTFDPKGVEVTHANLLHNERMVGQAFGVDEDSLVVGWLPLHHDMGLIGNVLQPLFAGARCVLMPPLAFLQRPLRWLRAISRYRGTTSGGPNFAYELCLRRIAASPPEELADLDLSSWRVAFNGAEPVRASTLERFASTLAPYGFRGEAFYPCYGLAEATLFVSGGERGRAPRIAALDAAALERNEARPAAGEGESSRRLVSCGHAWGGQRVVVADPETGRELPAGRVGEIWIAGPSVARGYWRNPEATERDFNARLTDRKGRTTGPYLRTGDLGFFAAGEPGDLFVAGRRKDLIILRGRNHHPQDLELTAERSHPDLRPGNGAAFAIELDGEERLIVVLEVERRRRDGFEEVAEAVRRAIAEEHEVRVHEVVLIRPGGLPKTSSGKVQRGLCRQLYLAHELPLVGRSEGVRRDAAPQVQAPSVAVVDLDSLSGLAPEERRERIVSFLLGRAAAALGTDPSLLAPDRPMTGLGLDSLSAVELKGSVESELKVELPLAELLRGATIAELADFVAAGLERESEATLLPPMSPSSRLRAGTVRGEMRGDQPLSAGQRGLWFLHQLQPAGGAYNIAVAARTRGLDPATLARALATLAERHDALRTVFPLVDDGPVLRVLPALLPDVRAEEATAWMDRGQQELERRLGAEAWRPFVLAQGPLLRARLFLLADGESVLLLAVHHLVADFTSMAVLSRELAVLCTREAGALPPAPAFRYSDFVRWQEERLAGARGEELWRYWLPRLAALPDLDLPTDRPRPPLQTQRGGARSLALPAGALDGLRRHGGTLFSGLLALFQGQLARYTGAEDFAVGAPTAGRPLAAMAGLVGYFVNVLAFRSDLRGEPTLGEVLDRTRRSVLEGLEHGDLPFPLLAERLRPLRDPSRSPLFQVLFVHQPARSADPAGLAAFALGEEGARTELGGRSWESVRIAERRSQFDLSLQVAEDGNGGLRCLLEFNADLFDGSTAERMLGHFRSLLQGAGAAPESAFFQLPLLAVAERTQLLEEWNATDRPYRRDLLLHQLFEARAALDPEAEALVAGERRLNYGELNRSANRLAHRLRELGVGPEERVALCLRRSERLIVALLAVLKAGGAYVPLDPAYPRERLELILADSGARWVVGEEGTADDLPLGMGVQRILYGPGAEEADLESESDPEPRALPGNLAYLIYTSGSTGRPKAVAIEHRSPVVLVQWAFETFPPADFAGVLAATSVSFDLSVFEIFVPLSAGGRIVLAENALELPRLAAAGEVTLVNTVPSAMAELVRAGSLPPSVRVVNLAGEPIPPSLVAALQSLSPRPRLYNLYGPSEDTTYSTFAHLEAPAEAPIGRPLANTRAYLLDRRGEPLPAGVPGELLLGGEGLARGYLGRPELTAERFVPDPFSEASGARLYRTGDLARLRPDGVLDFLGRADHQVKVRGFRIELGEVEAALVRHPALREAVVVALEGMEGDGKRLVAYLAPAGIAAAELRSFLRASLPEHMVPSAFVALEALPLSPNGKVDRRALPAPELPGASSPSASAFRNPLEERLAGLFAEVLGVERVGPSDDFFARGGHSLLATRLLARASRLFGVDLELSAIFLAPTVGALAERIARLKGITSAGDPTPNAESAGPTIERPAIPRVQRTHAGLPLSFAQRRLWFLDRLEGEGSAYHLPGLLRLTGPLDFDVLEAALVEIERRHEVLRTVFPLHDREPVQRSTAGFMSLSRIDLASLPATLAKQEEERLALEASRAPFDLERGPLWRALALRLGPERHTLALTLHHIVADGASLPILFAELAGHYEAFAAGRPSPLPELPLQYADWTVWQRERMSGAVLDEQIAWWRERLDALPVLALGEDRSLGAAAASGLVRKTRLPAAVSEELERLARREGVTSFMLLLSLFQAQLARYTGGASVPVGTPVANRGRAEIEGAIGLFVNTLVLRIPMDGNPAFTELLARTREVCLSAYAHQEVPFESLVEALRPERSGGRNPLFQAFFQVEEPLPRGRLGAAEAEAVRLEGGAPKFDLALSLTPGPDGYSAALEVDASRVDAVTAERFLADWRWLAEGIARAPETRLSDLPLLAPAERDAIRFAVREPLEEEPLRRLGSADPATPTEERLAAIWREVLGIERIGVHDDFFDLGGHSLLAHRILLRVQETWGVELPLKAFFEAPTIAGMAGMLALAASLAPAAAAKTGDDAPADSGWTTDAESASAGFPLEERLAAIWRDVLEVGRVGPHDDFFELGGHSVLAHRVVTRIASEIGAVLDLRALFDFPTVSALALYLDSTPEVWEGGEDLQGLHGLDERAAHPLSSPQLRLWLLDRLEPEGPKYNVPVALRLRGALDEAPLLRALAEIVRRHEPLRTVYELLDGEPVQVVLPFDERDFAVSRLDLSGLPDDVRERALHSALKAEGGRPFDLARGPVVRFTLLSLGAAERVLLAAFHHIATDGWSIAVFFRELSALYRDFAAGRAPGLPELQLRYMDWAAWQRQALEGGRLEGQIEHWRSQLADIPVLELPADGAPPALAGDRGSSRSFRFDAAPIERLRGGKAGRSRTPFHILLAGYAALLARLSGQDDFGVGITAAGRGDRRTEGLIGFFVNTLVARVRPAGDQPFLDLIERVRETVLDAQAHQDVPFERLVEALQPERRAGVSPFFQAAFTFMASPLSVAPMPGLEAKLLDVEASRAKFDLTLSVYEEGSALKGWVEYRSGRFEGATIERWMGHLRTLLEGAAERDLPISSLPLLNGAELWQLVGEENATASPLGSDLCLHELFELQAARTPEGVALVGEGRRLSYRELDEASERLARRLGRAGAGPEVVVGLLVERSPEMVIALLAVLKAAGAYLPLDPAHPAERLAGMLEDGGAKIVLTSEALRDRVPPTSAGVVVLEETGAGEVGDDEPVAQRGRAFPDGLAGVLFTSGSTGRPKGVLLHHRGLVNRLLWAQEIYRLTPADAVLHKAPLAFDFSLWEIFAPLIAGARLVVARPDGHRDPAYLAATIASEGVTMVHFVPSLLDLFLSEAERSERAARCGSLRQVFSGGERLAPELRERFLALFPSVPLDNQYGPTEISIDTTRFVCAPGQDGRRVPLGRPIANTRIHLLDVRGELVPHGVPGRLHVGGVGVTRGYAGRPEWTAERFVPDPFATGEEDGRGRRLYDTGDLARRLPDGTLEFLGRADQQVKVRGVRIEPAEVESALVRHPGIVAAAVAADADGSRLVAWIVPADGSVDQAPTPAELRDFLLSALPEAMVPSLFAPLEALPLTPSGKLDRRKLLLDLETIEAGAAGSGTGSGLPVTPATPVEQILIGIWSDLLGAERSGPDDSFFELGGHSLLAIRVVSRVREACGVELPLADLFAAPTPRALAARIAALRGEAAEHPREAGLAARPRDPNGDPLSSSQEQLWILDRLDPGSTAYNVAGALRLRGDLLPEALASALAEIVRRHEILRTTFREGGAGLPVQIVAAPAGAFTALPLVDLHRSESPEDEAKRLLAREARRPFDLGSGPLVRPLLVRLADDEHLLTATLHHIVSDAWSLRLVLRELAALYRAFAAGCSGLSSPLAEPALQYADFARWQRGRIAAGELDGALAYWRRALAGAPEEVDLPRDRTRSGELNHPAGRHTLTFPPALAPSLRALARRESWTPFMALFAAFGALLSRLSGDRELVVGVPVANRTRLETEALVGFFTNTLPLRLNTEGDPSFRSLARRTRRTTLAGFAHQELPFETLVGELAPHRSAGRNALFQVLLALDDVAALDGLELPGLELSALEMEGGDAKFDLTLQLRASSEGLSGYLEFDRALFDGATVERLGGHLLTLLEAALGAPETRLSRLPLLSGSERQELAAWSRAPLPAAPPRLVHERVAEQAALQPQGLAVVEGDATLTYSELVGQARRVAARLRSLGAGPDVPIGIFLDRSLDLAVAVLAVLESGAAYLPLDPAYPAERLAPMLDDARAPLVLTSRALRDGLPAAADRVVLLEDLLAPLAADATGMEHKRAAPENLAYVLYTSGSTGRPKGVAMPHGALSALLDWQLRTSAAGGGRTLQFAALSFDVSFQEIFSAWSAGGTVVLVTEEIRRDPPALLRLLAERRVERLFLPFVALQQLALAVRPGEAPECLREVMSAGEQLQVTPQVAALFDALPGAALYNHYGPTETHCATWLPLAGEAAGWPALPSIGLPVDHARVLLLDPEMELVPLGVEGEICIGGAGLARGYLCRPRLTAERFVPDPFVELTGWEAGSRLYRTGDRGRRLPGGEIEYRGRGDGQVKIRGHRVELAEVEAALAAHPALRQAAVGAPEAAGGSRRLTAYVVFGETGDIGDIGGIEEAPAFAELKAHLGALLPEAMVPTSWVRLEALPQTPSGKVDRRALELLEPVTLEGGGEREISAPPRDPVEEIVAGLWSEVLDRPRVGVHDDFFELGGQSLLATQVMSRLRDTFGVEVPLRRLFEGPTVAELAREVRGKNAALPTSTEQIRRRDGEPGEASPLSFGQERLWFLDRLQPGGTVYSLPLELGLDGALDPQDLAAAFTAIVRRHEALRTVFVERSAEPRQVVLPADLVELPRVDLDRLPDPLREMEAGRIAEAEARRPFDLHRGPLLRTLLLRLGESEHRLLLNLHHIVSDGWSMGVLIREMAALYRALREGRPSPLGELPIQYADYAAWQRRRLEGAAFAGDLDYWRRQLSGLPAGFELQADRPRPAERSWRGAQLRFAIDPGLLADLSRLGRREGATPFMVLAASMFALLSRLSGERDLALGTPIANRNRAETEGLIGFFVNTLVLRAQPDAAGGFGALLRPVREATLGAYAHQDMPFERLIEELQPVRDPSRTPLFQVMFALQNTPLPALALPGLAVSAREPASRSSKFDLTLALMPEADGLAASLEFSTDLFERTTAARFVEEWVELLRGAVVDPAAALRALPLLAPAQRHQIVNEWNDVPVVGAGVSEEGGHGGPPLQAGVGVRSIGDRSAGDRFEDHRPVHDRIVGAAPRGRPRSSNTPLHAGFERNADLRPEALAVLCDGETLTYGNLEIRANRLAHLLSGLGAAPGVPVAIWMERSLDMVVAALAVLKSGAYYLPLDPAWPQERAEQVLRTSKTRIVLTRSELLGKVLDLQWRTPLGDVVCLDLAEPEAPAEPVDTGSVRALWDLVSERSVDRATAGGFVSSYTGRPFSGAEVDDYRDRVLSLAAPWLRPEARVLEIGCGSGLIFWEIAPRVAHAVGIDPSEKTQERNRFQAMERGFANVELRTGFAHEIEDLPEGAFDLVILASTVQFFPGPLYLERVVRAALRRLAPGGALLVADVPDARRRADFQRSLAESGAAPGAVASGGAHIRWFDEDLFRDLGSLPEAAEVRIEPRSEGEEGFANELRFRYDVVLRRSANDPQAGSAQRARRKRLWTGWHADRQPSARPTSVQADSLAYVIHTSGSTGAPKGIGVRHRSASALVAWVNSTFEVGAHDRLLFVTSLGFDLSVYDLFGTLAAGGTIHVASEAALRDPERLAALLRDEPITIWDSAPAALQRLVPLFPEPGDPSDTFLRTRTLRLVLLSGDWIPVPLPDPVRAAFPGARVISLGGATEATVWSNWYPVGEVDPAWPSIPYGRPIAGARYYALDADLRPCPIGVPGDLYIAGEVLSVGYVYEPALTAESFLPDPYAAIDAIGGHGARMYRTGDRVLYHADGNLEFLGRVDGQVKVRGYRIELGEIEAALARHPGVREAVVVATGEATGEKRLVGYFIPAFQPAPEASALRAHLLAALPEYMVPWAFVELAAFPLTANGKLDRAALPAPRSAAGAGSGAGDAPPRNELERAIAAVWREVLEVDRVGVHDNFFESGGSSLLIVKLHARLKAALGREIPVLELFRHTTIDAQARKLAEAAEGSPETVAPVAVERTRERARTRQDSLRQLRRQRAGLAPRAPQGLAQRPEPVLAATNVEREGVADE